MGIFNLFKKNKPIEERETISQDEISEWLLNKKKHHKENESEFLEPIQERINQLISELELGITTLENVDLETKKVDHRIKLIVKENLKNYIGYLQKMINRLSEINKREKIVENINFAIDDFNKRSQLTYEKITFLVGKEMRATKDSIKKFLKDLEGILKSNAKDFEEFEAIQSLETQIEKFENIKQNKAELLQILNQYSIKLKQLKQNSEDKEKEIQDLKQSQEFKKEENKIKELELKKQKLGKELNNLKQSIDFKSLLKFYHTFENEMKLVKEYKENFQQTLRGSKIEILSSLLKEAKLETNEIKDLIQKINHTKQEIQDIKIKDTGLSSLEKEVDRIKSEINTINLDESIKQKKLKSLEQDLEDILKKIKNSLEKINVELE